ncbi:GNAT family N-acetyltransferase [Embleya sp. AB8]|uniref:GNAT family N-acetyltransferase n=1 Tax=Embleya sp. AB8 TaxID=3156304 RepID=UPI003C725911
MGRDVRIRHITEADWDAIVALEAEAYTRDALSEQRAALESRGRSSPATCFVLDLEQEPAGYLLALPYPIFQYPDLSRPEEVVFHSRNLHLHDLVIAERCRGHGFARELLHRLTATARAKRYERISLVSVGGSERFWSANGFNPVREVTLSASYGADAVYMSMAVDGDAAPSRRNPSMTRRAEHLRKTK